jgi:hypothetical protein
MNYLRVYVGELVEGWEKNNLKLDTWNASMMNALASFVLSDVWGTSLANYWQLFSTTFKLSEEREEKDHAIFKLFINAWLLFIFEGYGG